MALTKITPQMFDTSAAGHDFNIDNGTFVVDASANRVGIGTTTPSTLLDVNGVLTVNSNVDTTTGEYKINGVTVINSSRQLRNITAMRIGSTQIIDSSANLTNIGTISSGAITTSDVSTFSGGNTDYAIEVSSTDAYTGIRFTDPDGSGNLFYHGNSNHLYLHDSSFAVAGQTLASGYKFQVNGDSNFVGEIISSGNVGIGVPTPDQKLMVKGTIETVATNSANGWQLYTYTDNTFRVNYNGAGADELVLDTSGRLKFGDAPQTSNNMGDVKLQFGNNYAFGGAYSAFGEILNSQATIVGNNIRPVIGVNNNIMRHYNGTDAANFMKIKYSTGVTFHTGITTTQGTGVSEDTNERMRIDTSGNVGIGTTPGFPLHVSTSGNIPAVVDSSDTTTYFYIRNSNAATGRKTYLAFAPANNIHGAAIYAEAMEDFSTSANRTADLVFETRKDGTIGQHMRIFSDGKVKLTTPGNLVDGTYYSTLTINNTGSSTFSRLRFDRSGSARWGVGLRSDDKFQIAKLFNTANDNTFVIDSSGRIGINTAAPSRRKLEITDATPGIHFLDSDVTNLRHEIVGGGNAGLELSADYNNVGTGYIRLDVGGNNFHKFHEGGSILNRHVNSTQGRHFFVGTVSAWSNGNRYVHVQLSTTGNAMLAVHVFGYSYLQGLIEGMGAGYNYNNANQSALYNRYTSGSVANMWQNSSNSYTEVVIDTVGTATSNRWGAIAIYATDDLGQSDKIEIVQYAFNASAARLYT